jgi:hypothetical protein
MRQSDAGAIRTDDIVPVRPFASINEQIAAIALHPSYRRNWWIGILIRAHWLGS